ncbi:hypothetical protein ACFQ8C_14000 [Streptomyces sp. NPDC056503]|uniref:hypothetical protein n=1 Tax=Streptomyces sp. NPDC056503 TaxID=3345842 RepID=UPI003694CFC4
MSTDPRALPLRRPRRPLPRAACAALLSLLAVVSGAAPAFGTGGTELSRCAPSQRLTVRHWAADEALARVDVGFVACAWRMPDEWTVRAEAPRPAEHLGFRWRVDTAVRDEVIGGTHRRFGVDLSLTRCDPVTDRCDDAPEASWTVRYTLVKDGDLISLEQEVAGPCARPGCSYRLTAGAAAGTEL